MRGGGSAIVVVFCCSIFLLVADAFLDAGTLSINISFLPSRHTSCVPLG